MLQTHATTILLLQLFSIYFLPFFWSCSKLGQVCKSKLLGNFKARILVASASIVLHAAQPAESKHGRAVQLVKVYTTKCKKNVFLST